MQEAHKKLLKKLVQEQVFDALEAYYKEFQDKQRTRNVIGKNNGDTLKLTLMREGGILAVEEFFHNLEMSLYD